ncbi:hypothetical protein HYW35_03165 [Candidatus Saccharibacteria bacterium]|nr:hypothetical protein [Candidatus Saccharibacteria bacterium]
MLKTKTLNRTTASRKPLFYPKVIKQRIVRQPPNPAPSFERFAKNYPSKRIISELGAGQTPNPVVDFRDYPQGGYWQSHAKAHYWANQTLQNGPQNSGHFVL